MFVTASAPAKVILFGEHFVVFGEPAIVMAINQRARVKVTLRKDKRVRIASPDIGLAGTFDKEKFIVEQGSSKKARKELEPVKLAADKTSAKAESKQDVSVRISSDIPVAAGLGSSAAVVAATAKAISRLLSVPLSLEEIFNITCEAECIVHGTSSGIDPAVATYGGVLLFKRGEGFNRLTVKEDIPLIVGNTRIIRCTGDLVAKVRQDKENFPTIIELIIKAGGQIATQAVDALEKGNLKRLGELMNLNHASLYAVGVSSEPIEELITVARKAGALGAKLTGAGGGGCIIALSERANLRRVKKALDREGGNSFIAEKTDEGVRIER